MILAAAGAIILNGLVQEPKTFEDRETGFAFSYPAAWEWRKERLFSIFTIPLEGGSKAQVQVINVKFRQQADAWQTAQSDVAKTMNRTIDRQWDEVILGVPLLLTQLSYKEGETPMNSLVGLLYSRTEAKMSFRLTSPAAGYAQAEAAWRGALNSLKTISGSLPSSEDPTKPPQGSSTASGSQGGARTTQILADKPKTPKLPKGLKREPLEALGQKMEVLLPKAWSLTKKDSGYVLTRSDWTGEVGFDFGAGAILDMRKAVIASSNSAGAFLAEVLHRTETGPTLNSAGANVFLIERRGKGVISEGVTFEGSVITAGGHSGLYYWVTSFKARSGRELKKGTDSLKELHRSLLLSLQP